MRKNYRRRSSHYLLPFFLLVGIGIIAILAFQLWANLEVKRGDVYFYIASGKAKVLQYGLKEWEDGFNGTKLRIGDSVRTLGGSRLVLQFYNGTMLRLNEDTQLTLVDVFKNKSDEKMILALDHGFVWVDHVASEDTANSHVELTTSNLLIQDVGTVFAVEKAATENVHVLKGSVKVSVYATENKQDKVLSPLDVGIGQEVSFDANTLKAFRNDEKPSVLSPLSDSFKSSEWYSWNQKEDLQPTNFADIHDDISSATPPATSSSPGASQTPAQNNQIDQTPQAVTPTVPTSATASLLEITQPKTTSITIKEGKFTIQGKAGQGVSKIMVRQNFGGVSEMYALKKFKTGDTDFSYNLAEEYGNLKAGDNFYEFSAYDANDKKIATSDELTLHYDKPEVKITETLSTPKVLSFNGAVSSDGTFVFSPADQKTAIVKVVGEIHGAEKVVVNGYTLSQYKAGNSQWVYYANGVSDGGNLKSGLNEYEVYGVGPDGKESEHVKFTITYNVGTLPASDSNPTSTP